MTHRILVPIDFSANSRAAIARAEEIALATGAEFVVLFVGDQLEQASLAASGFLLPARRDSSLLPGAPREHRPLRVVSVLSALTEQLEARGVRARASQVAGSPAKKILDAIALEQADLVVMGTHGRQGVARFLLGSVSERVARDSPVPVLVCRAQPVPEGGAAALAAAEGLMLTKRLRNILVPTDFEACSNEAVRAAFELADKVGAVVHLLHAYRPVVTALANGMGTIEYAALHRQARERVRLAAQPYNGFPALGQCLAIMGDPYLTIVETAERLRAELIVVGSHGSPGIKRAFVGSVARKVLSSAPCEVLLSKFPLMLDANPPILADDRPAALGSEHTADASSEGTRAGV
jgi:nucleotide-binding universal stress UspA family protein